MRRVLVIGGGAAGMLAAVTAAECGHQVCLCEKNEKLGKKLFLTGKGRCNLTNACGAEDFFASVVSNAKFMYSSFYGFTNEDVLRFFERAGVRTKTERGNRVFPASGHSSDVIRGLERELSRLGVTVRLHTAVTDLVTEENAFHCAVLGHGEKWYGDACIIATGGLSYPSTGSTGDGYRFAEKLGHSLTPCIPSLVPLEIKESWVRELQGLSLKNVEVSLLDGNRTLFQDFGEMLFTHYGVSGPLILSASSLAGRRLFEKPLTLAIDLKPALDLDTLDRRIRRDFEENPNRQFKNALGKLLPAKLIPVVQRLSGIDPGKRVNVVSREERRRLAGLLKRLLMTTAGLRGYEEAVITKGGVPPREVDPGTMESKLVKGIYFAGEVLDLDALTGGFNLQIAWSTAHAAGSGIQ